jgi:hypothetical protein
VMTHARGDTGRTPLVTRALRCRACTPMLDAARHAANSVPMLRGGDDQKLAEKNLFIK